LLDEIRRWLTGGAATAPEAPDEAEPEGNGRVEATLEATVRTPAAIEGLAAGAAYPLGATFDGKGVNFAVYSEVASEIELCLFDEDGGERRGRLPRMDDNCWHGYLEGVGPGQRYGYRVHGPWEPARGMRCNPAKLLLDPYARAIEGQVSWDRAVFGHSLEDGDMPEPADSARFVPRSVVADPAFDWQGDVRPAIPMKDTIVYETHVKGFTALHPGIPPDQRGTYAGLAHPAAIRHLTDLGVTAVELMPVHQFVQEGHLLDKGLRNYWGYDSIGFFAPHNEYSSSGQRGEQVTEFKSMVRALHAAGIEVLLDVVYNHTAEGNHEGPTLSFRGFDNHAYYRLVADEARYYLDYTGTGNSVNTRHPQTLQLILDSLRYWVTEMHVDGFRFDLAVTVGRGIHEFDTWSGFFDIVHQDPVLRDVKLIAEPWDTGPGGYQLGNFPPGWSEWNGRFRDDVRDFWRAEPGTLGNLGQRLTGSPDVFRRNGRRPAASVNFVTSHDGFTLADLVSYDQKHNEANGEENRDGESHNRSWNCGVEGETDDEAVLSLRRGQQRNFLATLLLSQGVPILLGGDEIGRTQRGNNNAYCQDNETSWYDWTAADTRLLDFTRRLIRFRRDHPVLRKPAWFDGKDVPAEDVCDIEWFTPTGEPMTEPEWKKHLARAVGVFLAGRSPATLSEPIADSAFYLAFNSSPRGLRFTLPPERLGRRWRLIFDTGVEPSWPKGHRMATAGDRLIVRPRSVAVLQRTG
jgi:glycogen operon protein